MYDCYYDASYYAEKKNGIAGVYIENQRGKVVFEKQFPFEGINDSQEAEAFALMKALEVIQDFENASVRLLGDCKALIEGVWGGRDRYDALRDQMKVVGVSFNQLVWIYREYNKAHNLTKPIHSEKERLVCEVDVRYALTEHAYQQYKTHTTNQKFKPHTLIEKKLNCFIEEAKCFHIKVTENVQAFFRYGFILFVQNEQIIAIHKSEDNRNQYVNCKKKRSLLTDYFEQVYFPVKNQA